MVALDRRVGTVSSRVLGTYLAAALAHRLRATPPGAPWQHTLFVLGADKLRGDILDRLGDACEQTATGLVLAYRNIPEPIRSRLGRGNAVTAFMRLADAEDARAASEQLGAGHRFVLAQLTETIGGSVADTADGTYASTAAAAGSPAVSPPAGGLSRGEPRPGEPSPGEPSPGEPSPREPRPGEPRISESEPVSAAIRTSTGWGMATAKAMADSETLTQARPRSREFPADPDELRQLPASAMIVSYAAPGGRQLVLADANPGIGGLSAATRLTLEEFRARPVADPARSGGSGESGRRFRRPARRRRTASGHPGPAPGPARPQPGAAAAAPGLAPRSSLGTSPGSATIAVAYLTVT